MSDTTNTSTVPESWPQEFWNTLESWEQDVVAALHDAGLVFSADIWPYVKIAFTTLLSIAGKAALSAEVAAIPTELAGNVVAAAAAVGAAITGAVSVNVKAVAETEGKAALDAVQADPNATADEKAVAAEGENLLNPPANQ
jgi:GTP:adenosylcobinamide-phosphate guanylyltransferase